MEPNGVVGAAFRHGNRNDADEIYKALAALLVARRLHLAFGARVHDLLQGLDGGVVACAEWGLLQMRLSRRRLEGQRILSEDVGS